MPTSRALDRVAAAQGLDCYETPTGWKFFGNLMELKSPFLCGEESFGTGADHVREKDGVWAALAWLSVLAAANEGAETFVGVADVVKAHWRTYGRDLYCRHDYEECEAAGATAVMDRLAGFVGADGAALAKLDPDLESVTSFGYVDPRDGSETTDQGMVLAFAGGGRVVFRLSGTGSAGATVRVYVERPLPAPTDADLDLVASDALRDLADRGKKVADLENLTGRAEPSVIT
jgi:phosphoglucomutase